MNWKHSTMLCVATLGFMLPWQVSISDTFRPHVICWQTNSVDPINIHDINSNSQNRKRETMQSAVHSQFKPFYIHVNT